MLNAIRRNPMIAAGVLLPVFVAFFFSVAILVPKWLVDPPQHDFLFSMQDYRQVPAGVELRLQVIDERLEVRVYSPNDRVRLGARLFRYDASADAVDEITIPVPPTPDELEDGSLVDVPEVAGLRLSTSRFWNRATADPSGDHTGSNR